MTGMSDKERVLAVFPLASAHHLGGGQWLIRLTYQAVPCRTEAEAWKEMAERLAHRGSTE